MIGIKNLTKIIVDEKFLEKVAKIVLKGENKEKAELSIVLTGAEMIKKLNKRYRNKNKSTDVLAFANVLNSKFQVSKPELGEVVICPAEVKNNAKKFGISFKEELSLILIHGILHLLGYDHEGKEIEARKMEKKQEYYLSIINF